jgi:hypothetical protein
MDDIACKPGNRQLPYDLNARRRNGVAGVGMHFNETRSLCRRALCIKHKFFWLREGLAGTSLRGLPPGGLTIESPCDLTLNRSRDRDWTESCPRTH